MEIFSYHPEARVFVGQRTARLDPLETKKRGKNVYAIPACATAIPPPEPEENQIPVFDVKKKKWRLVPDFRGVKFYTPDGVFVIQEIGVEIPPEATIEPPPSQYHRVDAGQWVADIEDVRQARIAEAYQVAGRKIDALTDGYSVGEISAWSRLEDEARNYNAAATIGPIMQQELDAGSPRTANELAERIIEKADAFNAARARVVTRRQAHKQALEQLSTVEELLDYDVSAGWE